MAVEEVVLRSGAEPRGREPRRCLWVEGMCHRELRESWVWVCLLCLLGRLVEEVGALTLR